jgi:hypothetical protein
MDAVSYDVFCGCTLQNKLMIFMLLSMCVIVQIYHIINCVNCVNASNGTWNEYPNHIHSHLLIGLEVRSMGIN